MHICTIVARNYLPQARVLATTFHELQPSGHVTVLVIDDFFGEVDPDAEPFEVIGVGDLHGDVADLHRMAVLYDVLEYSTALKPWLLQTLLDQGSRTVTYLDPDIQVFAPLDEIDRLAWSHDVVLTPHLTAPLPRDGKMVTETAIMASGIYNLGFVAVGPSSGPFLRYWMERLVRECVIQPEKMRFVDQRWVDFAPGIFDVAILQDPTYNVAYWNLDHRDPVWTGRGYEIDGEPLHFFHFSGYSPKDRHLLSKHQTGVPRILLSERPDVAKICNAYGDLLEAHGYGSAGSKTEYGFARMVNGVPIDSHFRRLYRERVELADRGEGHYPPDPFSPSGADELLAWLSEPAEVTAGPARLNRYLATLFAHRPDLQPVFPDPQGGDYGRFLEWARHEAAAGHLDARLVPVHSGVEEGGADIVGRWAPSHELRPGITVFGYLRAELGVGEWARLTVQAIDAAGIPSATVTNTFTTSRQNHPLEVPKMKRYDFDVNLLCVNADQVAAVREQVGSEFFDGRYTIGQWAWELDEFPAGWESAFDQVDEIWAISEFARAAIAARTDKPVFTFPPAIVVPEIPVGVDRAAFGLPEGRYLFLYTFDLLSIFERKNPLGLIEAFCRAFPDGEITKEGPVLVVKVINGEQRISELERIRMAIANRPDILLIDRYLDVKEQTALMSAADCYVSLHRSEGFGLTIAEAMALAKPVIATRYSGNLDFMSDETAFLVSASPSIVPPGCDPYPAGAVWADPDIGEAAELMRRVFEHPDDAAEVGRRARESVLAEHGIARRAQFVKERFEAIEAARGRSVHMAGADEIQEVEARSSSAPEAGLSLVDLALARPSLAATAGRLPRMTRFYRRAVLRLQRHHDEHQRQIDVALAEHIEHQGRTLEEGLARMEGALGAFVAESSRQFGAHDRLLRTQADRLAGLRRQAEAGQPRNEESGRAPVRRPRANFISPKGRRMKATDISDELEGADVPVNTQGSWDFPVGGSVIEGEVLVTSGWLLLGDEPAASVEVEVDGSIVGRARYLTERPDVGMAFGLPAAPSAGFEHRYVVPLDPGRRRELAVRLHARSRAGVSIVTKVRHAELVRSDADSSKDLARGEELAVRTRRVLDGLPPISEDGPLRILVCAHDLSIGGAQLYLLELLRKMRREHDVELVVVSPSNGVLRSELENLGAEVHVTGAHPVRDVDAYEGRIREMALFARHSGCQVALVNTLDLSCAADAMERAGLPVVWAIHESYALEDFAARYWGTSEINVHIKARWLAALRNAAALVFVADATKRMFEPYGRDGRSVTIPYGVNLAAIDAFVGDVVVKKERAQLGLPDDAVVLLGIGLFESRKAQGALVEAFAQVADAFPEAVLALVGDIPGPYSDAVHELVIRHRLQERVRIEPVTSDTFPWFTVADVLVSASDTESLPRSILEAMAFHVPVLSTDVFGVPEVITDGRTGWLFAPNDGNELTRAMIRVLSLPAEERAVVAEAAADQVRRGHDSAGYARDFHALLDALRHDATVLPGDILEMRCNGQGGGGTGSGRAARRSPVR